MNVTPLRPRQSLMPERSKLLALLGLSLWLSSLAWTMLPGIVRRGDDAFYLQRIVEDITHLSLWVALWAWVTHTCQQRTRLADHTALATSAAALDNALLGLANPWAFFALGWPWPAGLYELSRTALITLTALLHLHLACQGLNPRRLGLWLLASTLALAVTLAQNWIDANDSEALDRLTYQPNLYPAIWVKTPEHGIEDGLKVMWDKWGQAQNTKDKP